MSLRDRLAGTRDHLGWWTLPVFIMVGLIGAVLAGALSTVYYGQQVDELADETARVRRDAERASQEIEDARERALEEIDTQVQRVEETLSREFPLENVAGQGVASLRAQLAPPPPSGGQSGQGAQQQPSTPTSRIGSGFAVANDGAVVFFATTYGLVADPNGPGGVAERVEVTANGNRVNGTVHTWDEDIDLALVRAEVGQTEILRWRPADRNIERGERVVVAGVTPQLEDVQLPGLVAFNDLDVLVTDIPPVPFLRGAPIVDGDGHVIGVYAMEYAPFGGTERLGYASVPAQQMCADILRDCDALAAEG
jgi:S1-C subfamily serine protease